ncbi:phosphotransferase [Microbacteriaceae bacterium VKM Ac-2854]|nr:phosphotransferase [Microbacteriaceae bacterium VKM Ac-2854]
MTAIMAGLGHRVTRVDALGGVENHVHRVRGPGLDAVLRTPVDPACADTYPLEAWAIGAARAAGVPSPPVLALGERVLVLEYWAPQGELTDPWRRLGALAAAVARIPLDSAPDALFSRFGRDLPAAWRAHVRYNVAALTPDDPLLGAYPAADRERLRELIAPLAFAPFAHGLAHGDLAPRNLIPRAAAPALIDWGAASTGPAPWTELQRVYQEQPPDALAAFAVGAGVTLDSDILALLHRLTVLRSLDLARWAREHRPDLAPAYAARIVT